MNPAFAPQGAPGTPMANVIDSLKRLERVGSENSKTTEKLLEAADELSRIIVEQFAAKPEERIELPTGRVKVKATVKRAVPRNALGSNEPVDSAIESSCFASYAIDNCTLVFSGLRMASAVDDVAGSRANALRFSEDVADGLLDLLADIVVERHAEAAKGVGPLQDALNKVKG